MRKIISNLLDNYINKLRNPESNKEEPERTQSQGEQEESEEH
jgi:hypothetical protein